VHDPATQQVAATALPSIWSRAFPAAPAQVRQARNFLSVILDDRPAADDAILCLSELVTNAAIHSNSRRPGGHFTVRVQLSEGCVRVEVQDEGGPWTQPVPGDLQHGRGLHIISRLARAWGITGDCCAGWTVWAEVTCP
jgi:anti-sigma regulatory factor (Ser/Thr protein kinase)